MRRILDAFPLALLAGFMLGGCLGPPPGELKKSAQTPEEKPAPQAGAGRTAPHKPRELLVFIPVTDEGAGNWLKVFARHPKLRMVIAMSPRFHRFDKDPALKGQFVALEKSGRVELALQ